MAIEVKVSKSKKTGEFFWRILEVGNHKVIGIGGQLFARRAGAKEGYDNLEGEIVRKAIEEKDLIVFRKEELLQAIEKIKEGEFLPDQLLDVSVYKG